MNKLNYFIALVYSAFLVQAATVLLVLSAEMAFSKWVAMHSPRELRAGTFCACDCTWNVSCQSIVRSAQLRKSSPAQDACWGIIRAIDGHPHASLQCHYSAN